MITYRDAVIVDMPAVAALHKQCFKGTFIAYWGDSLIARYYQKFVEEGGPFVLAFDGDKLIAFCMGYYEGSNARNSFLKENKIRLALRMFLLCLSFNKLVLKKCWNFVIGTRKKDNADKPKIKAEADLLSICVLQGYRGHGVAVELVNQFEKRVAESGKKDLTLAVYQDNERAIAFYKKMGYEIAGEDSDEYKMYKRLTNDNN